MKLTSVATKDTIDREWIVLDATDKIFGRLISDAAFYLRGKHKPNYTPHIDCGDHVVIINASKVKFSHPKKMENEYYRHTGYFGGVKSEKTEELLKKNPEKLFKLAARGMLPKTKLGKSMIKKLKVYAGGEHPHTAQMKGRSE